MKTLAGCFLTVLLFGCSQQHVSYVDQTVNVVAGKTIAVRDYVLSVKERNGSALNGIQVIHREADGNETFITANTGTVTEGPRRRIEAPPANGPGRDDSKIIVIKNTVKLTLFNAQIQIKSQSRTNRITVQQLELNL